MKSAKLLGVILLSILFSSVACSEARDDINVTEKNWIFQSGRSSVIEFKLPNSYNSSQEYLIKDYNGRLVSSGTLTHVNGNSYYLNFNLPQGYYEISIPDKNKFYGIIVRDDLGQQLDSYFGVDVPYSLLGGDLQDIRDGVHQLSLAGFRVVRERLIWKNVANQNGLITQEVAKLKSIYSIYKNNDIDLLVLIQAPPANLAVSSIYPEGPAAEKNLEDVLSAFKEFFWSVEVANEPNLSSHVKAGGEQLRQFLSSYARYNTLASSAVQQAPTKLNLVLGAFSGDVRSRPEFFDGLNKIRFTELGQRISFHTYAAASQLEGLINSYRSWYSGRGVSSPELWITESGWPGQKNNINALSDDWKRGAVEVPAKAMLGYALGVKHYFVFTYPNFRDENGNFGLISANGSPNRTFASYLNISKILSGSTSTRIIHGRSGAIGVLAKNKNNIWFIVYCEVNCSPVMPRVKYGELRRVDGSLAESFDDAKSSGLIYMKLSASEDLTGLDEGNF